MTITVKSFSLFTFLLTVAVACRKNDHLLPEGNLVAPEYTYNVAIKGFQPDPVVKGTINTNFDIKVVYYYLRRSNKSDSLIQLDFLQPGTREHAFAIDANAWAGTGLTGVKGLKVLCVRDNNTSVEKFISIGYFDPAAPVLSDLPPTITPALTGTTPVTGKAVSETGLRKIYFYDNSTGSFKVIDSLQPNGSKDLAISYQYPYTDGAGQLKVEAVDIYGLKAEKIIQFVNIPFKPVITFATDSLRTALPDGRPQVTGTFKTFTPISQVNAYIVTASGESLLGTIIPMLTGSSANEYNYAFSIDNFPYAAAVTGCRLLVADAGSNNSSTVPVKILPYYYWKNLTMMAQGNATVPSASCFFVGNPAQPVLSACEVVNDANTHANIDFAVFCNSTPLIAFNNPANISASTIATFKCNGISWNPATPTASSLKKTLFRVLGTGSAETNVKNQLDANTITQLGDAFFAGISAPTANAPNSSTFAVGSVIYVKMTPAGGGITKNILIKVINVNIVGLPNQSTSTLTIDILKEQ